MRKFTITLAGEEREFPELTSRKAAEWRELAAGPLSEIMETLRSSSNFEIANTSDLLKIIDDVKPLLLSSIDTIRDLVIAYTGIEKEWALDNTYDSEYIEAIVPVMRMGYPYDFLLKAARRIGAIRPPTMTNGHSQNMENGQMSSTKSSSSS